LMLCDFAYEYCRFRGVARSRPAGRMWWGWLGGACGSCVCMLLVVSATAGSLRLAVNCRNGQPLARRCMLLMEPFQVTAISSRIIAILYGFLATVLINTCEGLLWSSDSAAAAAAHCLLPLCHPPASTSHVLPALPCRLRQPGGGADCEPAVQPHQFG